jgi:hypothetical protein
VITVDTTAAFPSFRGVTVDVAGGAGFDRLHLTGKLNDRIDAASRITGNTSELTIEALAEIPSWGI